jgi:ribokinase
MAPALVVVVGSVNLDLVVSGPRLPRPGETVLGASYGEYAGGKGLNQAVAAARAGARTSLCACIGDDEAGTRMRQAAAEAGVETDHLQVVSSAPTGRAIIATSTEQGQNLIVVAPGANSALSPEAAIQSARGARVVLAQLEVPVATVTAAFRAAREQGAVTILNPAPAGTATDELLSLCDFAVVNESEADALGGADGLTAAGARNVIVTLGERGATLFTPGQPEGFVEAFEVDTVDTTAAGDALCGAFAAALAQGAETLDALRIGAAAGALATTRAGAVPSLPAREEIDALLERDQAAGGHSAQR